MKRLYVGNLPDDLDDAGLVALFAPYGAVAFALVVRDADTGAARGFGFVEMEDDAADRAVAGLDGLETDDGLLRVNESRDRGQPAPRRRW
ncbi:MAG TPA: RNA-binding protein [Candidatus Krumholzibacteria bacterium]|nr:RNA-binding protein [Candidatus Krumholzibacteria bacterium]